MYDFFVHLTFCCKVWQSVTSSSPTVRFFRTLHFILLPAQVNSKKKFRFSPFISKSVCQCSLNILFSVCDKHYLFSRTTSLARAPEKGPFTRCKYVFFCRPLPFIYLVCTYVLYTRAYIIRCKDTTFFSNAQTFFTEILVFLYFCQLFHCVLTLRQFFLHHFYVLSSFFFSPFSFRPQKRTFLWRTGERSMEEGNYNSVDRKVLLLST